MAGYSASQVATWQTEAATHKGLPTQIVKIKEMSIPSRANNQERSVGEKAPVSW